MSFSSPSGGGGGGETVHPNTPDATAGAPAAGGSPHQNFGQVFSHILQQKYPIAGGLANAVFGGGNTSPQVGTPPGYSGMASAPLPQMQSSQPTDYSSMIESNAKPPSGGSGGLGALLSLFL